MEEVVKGYFNPAEPGSFSGLTTFARHSKASFDQLAPILAKYPAYTRHTPARRRFPRNKIITNGPDHVWFADLADVSELRTFNNQTRFLLCVVDGFSKKGFVEPLKNKTTTAVRRGFENIFVRTTRRPKQLFTDAGKEFTGKELQIFLGEHNIEFRRAYNTETKAAPAEIFLKNFKRRIYRYLTHHSTNRYLSVLRDFEDSYNNTYHRAIGTTPNSVDHKNMVDIWHRLYDVNQPYSAVKRTFRVGDYVRLAAARTTFQKVYKGAWTAEVFKVVSVRPGQPSAYRVRALDGEAILGTFSPYELQKVPFDESRFVAERILKTRKRKGKKEYLVRWQGRPVSFDSWTTNRQQRQAQTE